MIFDEALPPLFFPNTIDISVNYRPKATTDSTWDGTVAPPLFGDWLTKIGNPPTLVAGFPFQAWSTGEGCLELETLAVLDPTKCFWPESVHARTGDCSIANMAATVEGAAAPHLVVAELRPEYDYDAIQRVANELAEQNRHLAPRRPRRAVSERALPRAPSRAKTASPWGSRRLR